MEQSLTGLAGSAKPAVQAQMNVSMPQGVAAVVVFPAVILVPAEDVVKAIRVNATAAVAWWIPIGVNLRAPAVFHLHALPHVIHVVIRQLAVQVQYRHRHQLMLRGW